MCCSFFSIIGDPSKGFFCYGQGYTTHFFCLASFLWTTTIALTLHRTVVRHKTDVEDLEPMFHLYVWGTSGVMTVIRSIANNHEHLSRLGTWCWAQTGHTGKATDESLLELFYRAFNDNGKIVVNTITDGAFLANTFQEAMERLDRVAKSNTFQEAP
ncbi:G-protein coupled receptor 1-like [Solanum dulcamara]|uniref:G-protein coupled receptor 1-like n=1 Tax=Solanum dulcamara TaxID=45834 RepID=UPI0024860039|nr:G-protein coupled receptor 1-like [Solanum dulcamara]